MTEKINITELATFFYRLPDRNGLWQKINENFDHWVCFKNYSYEEIIWNKQKADNWYSENKPLFVKKKSIIDKEMEGQKTINKIKEIIAELEDKEIADKSIIFYSNWFYYIDIARRFKDKSVWIISSKNWVRWKNKKKIEMFIATKDKHILD